MIYQFGLRENPSKPEASHYLGAVPATEDFEDLEYWDEIWWDVPQAFDVPGCYTTYHYTQHTT